MRTVCIFTLMVLANPLLAQEPSFNGRTISEWATILKDDATPRKRRAAVVALGQIAEMHKDVLPQVMLQIGKALRNDPVGAVRGEGANWLAQQKVDENLVAVLPDLVESVRIEREVPVKKQVTIILGRLGKLARSAVVPLTDNLKDADPGVRAATADALGRIGPDAKVAAPRLLELFPDQEASVRQAAIFAAGRVEPEDPKPVAEALLKKLTQEPDRALRQEAVLALGFLGYKSPEVVKGIVSRFTEKDAEMRVVVSVTLPKFAGSLGSVQNELAQVFKQDSDKQVRLNLVRVLTLAAGENRTELLKLFGEQLVQDSDFEVRIAIAEELGTFGPAGLPAIPALRQAQRDSQVKVRDAATRAIRAIEKKDKK